MQRLKTEVKGITLMVLVITIIVMLILAAVAVKLTLGDGGVLSEARSAANEWDKVTEEEQSDLSKLAQEMRTARNGIYNRTTGSGGNSTEGGDTESKKPIGAITGEEESNTETEDKDGNPITIPAGFKVINPESRVNDGIVIEDVSGNNADTIGNQFVWIPCEIKTEGNKNDGKLKYDRYAFTFARESPTWDYRQSLILGTNGEYEKDTDGSYKIQRADNTSYYYHEGLSEEERVSIERYGGYYIGRYEVGTDNARSSSGNITAVARVKANLPVYNYVTKDEAVTIAERMYSGKSKLCSSYAWDTVLQFISGEYAVKRTGDNYTGSLANTGYHAEKNIYDMGANVCEWTTESYTLQENPCVTRRWLLQP